MTHVQPGKRAKSVLHLDCSPGKSSPIYILWYFLGLTFLCFFSFFKSWYCNCSGPGEDPTHTHICIYIDYIFYFTTKLLNYHVILYIVLHCIVLHCIVLHCIVLYILYSKLYDEYFLYWIIFVLHYIIYCVIWNNIVLYFIILRYLIILRNITLYYVILKIFIFFCFTILYYVVYFIFLYHDLLYYTVACYVLLYYI